MRAYRNFSNWAVGGVAATLASVAPAVASGQFGLVELEREIVRTYSDVDSLLPEQLLELLRERDGIVLLDAREQSEFQISRIPGATRVDPDIGKRAFMRTFGAAAKDRLVVVYCSVGVRSSRLARRVDKALKTSGSRGAVNLQGGIFAWHNTGRSLKQNAGTTDYVHPYSRSWSRYLDFDNYTKYRQGDR